MENIRIYDFTQLRNNEHGQFHSTFRNEVITATPHKLGIEKLFPGYAAALDAELQAIEVEQGSQFTKSIEETDAYRDQLYRAYVLNVRSCSLNYDAEVQKSAQNILRIIEQVRDMRKQPYNQESETIVSLIGQIKTNYAADVEKCRNGDLLDKLEKANNQFINHFGTRANEVSSRLSGNVRIARNPVDEGFKNIITVINAMALINGVDEYKAFIDKVNYLIDYNRTTLKSRKTTGKGNKSGSTENPS